MKLGILEEVKEHTDWVNSHVIVEKDTGSHHSPNHTIKKKLRICLDPWDIFQSKLDSIFIGMEGVTGIADDMVIAGRD